MITTEFLEEIKQFETIYCLISGGYHSTTTALLLKDHGFDNVKLLHNRTYLETKESMETMKKVIELTKYPYVETFPNIEKRPGEIIRESFKDIDKIIKCMIDGKKNHRDFISCCRILKKSPARRWYTQNIDKENSVIISSLCPFESSNRSYWLKELRDKDTYLRLHKKMGNVYYAYPFRDVYSNEPFRKYLISKDFFPEHSGCIICPIRVAYMIKKNDIWDCPEVRFYEKMFNKKLLKQITL